MNEKTTPTEMALAIVKERFPEWKPTDAMEGFARAVGKEIERETIAAHSAFIREAAWKDDVVKAGYDECAIEWNDDACKRCLPEIFRAMLDQIERTPDEG